MSEQSTIPPAGLEYVAEINGWRLYRNSAGEYEAHKSYGYTQIGTRTVKRDGKEVEIPYMKASRIERRLLPTTIYERAVAMLDRMIAQKKKKKPRQQDTETTGKLF